MGKIPKMPGWIMVVTAPVWGLCFVIGILIGFGKIGLQAGIAWPEHPE